jgi:Rod binding domain-containing protein
MKINTSLNISKQEQQLKNIEKDKEKAGEIFEKMLLQEMIKGMYKTVKFEEEESSVENDFYQDQMIDILSDKIVEAKALNIKEKLFKD